MRLLIAVLTLLCLSIPAWAANTATELGTLPVSIKGESYDAKITLVHYDTPSGDLNVSTASASNLAVCEVGFFMSDGDALTLNFKPSTGNSLPLILAANQGIYHDGVGLCTVPGSNFVINSTVAFDALLYIIQTKRVILK